MKKTREQALIEEDEVRERQLDGDGKALLRELAAAESEAQAAAARVAEARAQLDRLETAKRELDAKPDLRPVTEEPAVMLAPVIRAFPGDNVVYDAGALLDPDTIPNFAILQSNRLPSFGTVVHPRSVVARGRICGTCGVIYRSEPEAAAHWRRERQVLARRAEERKAQEIAEKAAGALRAETQARNAQYEGWGRERDTAKARALNPPALHPGYPIPRPPTREETEALRGFGRALSGAAVEAADGDGPEAA